MTTPASETTQTKQALGEFSQRDRNIAFHSLTGGAMMGGAAGLVAALANMLRQNVQDATPDTSLDDDTLNLYIPETPSKKQTGKPPRDLSEEERLAKMATLGTTAGLIGAGLGGLGAYNIVQRIYQKLKGRQLQKELDAAQNAYLGTVSTEADALKSAGQKAPGMLETLLSAPPAAAALWGLGTGALTYKLLDRYFGVQRPKVEGPKHVVLRSAPAKPAANPNSAEEDLELKMAFALDPVVRVILARHVKQASVHQSELCMMVLSCAAGRAESLKAHIAGGPIKAAAVSMSDAFNTLQDEVRLTLGIQKLLRDPVLSKSAHLLIAAEAYDLAPNLIKISMFASEAQINTGLQFLTNCAWNNMVEALRPDEDAQKQASMGLSDLLGSEMTDDMLTSTEQSQTDTPDPTVSSESPETNSLADVIDEIFKAPSKVVDLTRPAARIREAA